MLFGGLFMYATLLARYSYLLALNFCRPEKNIRADNMLGKSKICHIFYRGTVFHKYPASRASCYCYKPWLFR